MWRTRRRGSKALGADVAADAHQDSKAVAPPPPPPPPPPPAVAPPPPPPPAVAPDVRELAARRDIPGLVEALGYKANSPYREHFSVRDEAAFALGEIGDPLAIVPLISAFDDLYSRVSAAYALAAIGTPAFEPLLRTVQDASVTHGRGPRERSRARDRASTALSALGRMKDPRAVEPLILTLKSQGPSDNFGLDTRYVVGNWSGHLRLPGVSGGELGKGVESVDAVFRGRGCPDRSGRPGSVS